MSSPMKGLGNYSLILAFLLYAGRLYYEKINKHLEENNLKGKQGQLTKTWNENRPVFNSFLIIFLMLISLTLFVGLYCLVDSGGSLSFDESAIILLHEIQSPLLNLLVLGITHTATYVVLCPIVAMIIYLWRRGEKRMVPVPIISFIVFSLIGLLLKVLVARPRPSVVLPVMVEPLFSFPSGHVMMAVGVYGLISLLLWQRQRQILSLISGVWVLLIAFSRLYLGVHYPSDVIASLLLGFVLLGIFFWIDRFFITGRFRDG